MGSIGSSLFGKKSGGISYPSYQEPTPYNMNTPYGNVIFKDGAWQFQDVGTGAEDRNTITAMRNAILKTIGVTGSEREASLKNWQDTFFKESQRVSQPALEQSLFARGLGGSRLYGDSLTDLLSKIGTQSVLNAESMRQADEATKLNQLGALGNLLSNDQSNISNLLSQATGTQATRAGQALSAYQSTLPLASSYSGGDKNAGLSSLIGSLSPYTNNMLSGLFSSGSGVNKSALNKFGGGARAYSAPSNVYSLSF